MSTSYTWNASKVLRFLGISITYTLLFASGKDNSFVACADGHKVYCNEHGCVPCNPPIWWPGYSEILK